MEKKIDLTFFYQVKARFFAEPGTLVFISVNQEKMDTLVPQVFTEETIDTFFKLMHEQADNEKAYFGIDNMGPGGCLFGYVCKEFCREEEYDSGKLLWFKLEPFKRVEVDLESLKRDLLKLNQMSDEESKAS